MMDQRASLQSQQSQQAQSTPEALSERQLRMEAARSKLSSDLWEKKFVMLMPDAKSAISQLELRRKIKDPLLLLDALAQPNGDRPAAADNDAAMVKIFIKHRLTGLVPDELKWLLTVT